MEALTRQAQLFSCIPRDEVPQPIYPPSQQGALVLSPPNCPGLQERGMTGKAILSPSSKRNLQAPCKAGASAGENVRTFLHQRALTVTQCFFWGRHQQVSHHSAVRWELTHADGLRDKIVGEIRVFSRQSLTCCPRCYHFWLSMEMTTPPIDRCLKSHYSNAILEEF